MIRKPGEEDFRESEAVRALRETRKVTVAGAEGIATGLHRLFMLWFGGIMAFGFIISLVGATGGLALVPLVIGGVLYWRSRRENEAARAARLREHTGRLSPSPTPGAGHDPAAFPPEIRREGHAEADIGAVVQQAFVLFAIGFLMMLFLRIPLGAVAIIAGMMCVVLAVLIASRVVGHRKLIEWDTRKVRVWHLLSEGEMQWSDVLDVTVETSGRLNLAVYFHTGSRRNIVLTAAVNRLGGPTTLRVPIRYLNLPQSGLEALLRDLFCWQAAGQSIAPAAAAPAPAPAPDLPPASPITPWTDPRRSFDPDAIMARYLREREESLARIGREAPAPSPAEPPQGQRPVFGRKRA